MKTFLRFTALATLTAFLGLHTLEAFHSHAVLQANANCSICKIASRTDRHVPTGSASGPQWVSAEIPLHAASQPYVYFLSVTHGLSPPTL